MKRTLITLGFFALAACAVEAGSITDNEVPDAAPLPPGPGAPDASLPQADAGVDASQDAGDCLTQDFCEEPNVVEPLVTLNAVWGTSENDVWAVGTRGAILHRDAAGFRLVSAQSRENYYSVWGQDANDVWILGDTPRRVVRAGSDYTFEEVVGAGYNPEAFKPRLWAVGGAGGETWMAGFDSAAWDATWASLWRLGSGDAGAAWLPIQGCEFPCSPQLYGLRFFAPGSAWAVGAFGATLRLEAGDAGPVWNPYDARSAADLHALWGTSDGATWAVGAQGTIRYFDGSEWQPITSPTAQSLHAIWGTQSNDVWAVGDAGTLLHYDGTAWSLIPLPAAGGANLYGIWGSSDSDVWIVGSAIALHRTAANRRRTP